MHKIVFLIIITILLFSCKNERNNLAELKPGLGEYMAMAEYHYTNLGTAITNKNYKRASYEIEELNEVFEKVKLFHNNHGKLIKPMDSLLPIYFYQTIKHLSEALSTSDSLKINVQ